MKGQQIWGCGYHHCHCIARLHWQNDGIKASVSVTVTTSQPTTNNTMDILLCCNHRRFCIKMKVKFREQIFACANDAGVSSMQPPIWCPFFPNQICFIASFMQLIHMSTQLLTNQKECSIAAAAFDVIFTMGYFQLIYPTFKIPGGMWLCGAQTFLWI